MRPPPAAGNRIPRRCAQATRGGCSSRRRCVVLRQIRLGQLRHRYGRTMQRSPASRAAAPHSAPSEPRPAYDNHRAGAGGRTRRRTKSPTSPPAPEHLAALSGHAITRSSMFRGASHGHAAWTSLHRNAPAPRPRTGKVRRQELPCAHALTAPRGEHLTSTALDDSSSPAPLLTTRFRIARRGTLVGCRNHAAAAVPGRYIGLRVAWKAAAPIRRIFDRR